MGTKENYNPHSSDATFAKILQRLDTQDEVMAKILEQTTKTNGRVTKVELKANSSSFKLSCLSWCASALLVIAGIFCGVFHDQLIQQLYLHDTITSVVSNEFDVNRKP